MIRFDVIDTGIDIPQELQIDVFKPFFHMPYPQQVERGSWFELYIVHELVELQGGRVWVESTPGKGSTFSFTLPQAAS